MIQPLTIKKAKKFRDQERQSLLPVILNGDILEISPIQRLNNNRHYVVFELADDTDYATFQVWGSSKEPFKAAYLAKICQKGDKLEIIEPRKPNVTWSRKGIDFWISSQLPPIGTDLSGFMNWMSKNPQILSNTAKTTVTPSDQGQDHSKVSMTLQTADQLLPASSIPHHEAQPTNRTTRTSAFQITAKGYSYKKHNQSIFQNQTPDEWCTIWTVTAKSDQKPKFLGRASIYGKTPETGEWICLLKINTPFQNKFKALKENIEQFYDFKKIHEL